MYSFAGTPRWGLGCSRGSSSLLPTSQSDAVAYLAVSLDGYVAETDGSVDFLQKYPMEDFNFDAFIEGVGALIVGSTTYEQSLQWGWPWGDRPTMVLTTRTGLDVPDGADITFSSMPTAEAIRSFSASTPKQLWVLGGGTVVTDGLRGSAIDTLDITVLPEALGSGIPQFTDGYEGPMTLVDSQTYPNGAIRLIYQPQK